MSSPKFKDCLAEHIAGLEFDIEIDGKHFGRGKALSFRDQARITAKSKVEVDGEMVIDNALALFYFMLYTITEWNLGVPVSEAGLEYLFATDIELFNKLALTINNIVAKQSETIEGNEKN